MGGNLFGDNEEFVEKSGPGSDAHSVLEELAYLFSLDSNSNDNWEEAQEILIRYGKSGYKKEIGFPAYLTECIDKLYFDSPNKEPGNAWLYIALEIKEKMPARSVY